MRVNQCECGELSKASEAKQVGSARRRRYVCRCGEQFATIEIRVPKGMEVPLFQARVNEVLKKENA